MYQFSKESQKEYMFNLTAKSRLSFETTEECSEKLTNQQSDPHFTFTRQGTSSALGCERIQSGTKLLIGGFLWQRTDGYKLTNHERQPDPEDDNNDLSQTSHCNIKGVSVSEVMRIENRFTPVKFY